MAKTLQLTIPNACHEDWQAMTPDEKGRYCMACRKTVVDFTNMSDREILEYFSSTSGSICGHMHADQLNRNMVVQRKPRLPWLKYFFQFTLPAIFVSMKTQAQDCKKPEILKTQRQKSDPTQLMPVALNEKGLFVKGRVVDKNNAGIPAASVMLKGTGIGTITDHQGNFSIEVANEKDVIAVFTSIGYEAKEIYITPGSSEELTTVNLVQLDAMMMDGVIVVVGSISRKPAVPKRSPLEIARSIITPDSVRIFPNPVGLGNDIELQLQVKKPGNYYVEVSDFSGRLMLKKELQAEAKSFKSSINTKQFLSGTYIVCVRNREGKKIGVKKILVQ